MPARKIAVCASLITAALIAQLTVLPRLRLPGSTPDVILLVVMGLAVAYGSTTGMVAGFSAGLATDLLPPADHAVGRLAFVLCVVGYLTGLLRDELRKSAPVSMGIVVGMTVVGMLLSAGLGALLGDLTLSLTALTRLILVAVCYQVLLSPFFIPAVLKLVQLTEPRDLLSEVAR